MTPLAWIVALAALLVGTLLGFLGLAWWHRRSPDRQALEALRTEHDAYRRDVESHFGRTSEIFRELNDRYRTLYEHMAEGATSLCTGEPPTPELELAQESLLPRKTPAAAPASDEIPGEEGAVGEDGQDSIDEGEEAAADARVAAETTPGEDVPPGARIEAPPSAAAGEAAPDTPARATEGPASRELHGEETTAAPEPTAGTATPVPVPPADAVAEAERSSGAPGEPRRTIH